MEYQNLRLSISLRATDFIGKEVAEPKILTHSSSISSNHLGSLYTPMTDALYKKISRELLPLVEKELYAIVKKAVEYG